MSGFQRYLCSILMACLTSWMFVLAAGLWLTAYSPAEVLLANRVFALALVCAGVTALFYLLENCCTWSGDLEPRHSRHFSVKE